jgi:hypothetical protein
MKVSFFTHSKIAKGEKPLKDASLGDILQAIKEGRWKNTIEQIRAGREELKEKLPCFKLSGTFGGGADDDILTYNGLMQLDLDKITLDDALYLKELLTLEPFVLSAFLSPRNGLKIIVRTSPPENLPKEHWKQWHNQAWNQIENYFNRLLFRLDCYTLKDSEWVELTLDSSTKSIGKNLFVSYDPDLYYNADCIPFPLELISIEEKPKQERVAIVPMMAQPQQRTTKGGFVDDADYQYIFSQLPQFFPEMNYQWSEPKGGYVSSLGIGGRVPKHSNFAKTIATIEYRLGTNGLMIWFKEVGEQETNLWKMWGVVNIKKACGKFIEKRR